MLTGVFRYANTWPTAIALVESGRVELDAMVTARYPLEKAAEALDSDRTPGNVKTVVTVIMKLNNSTLAQIPISKPSYDRDEIGVGIVHFGVGGFHRAHQAMYVDRLLEKRLAKVGYLRCRRHAAPTARWPTSLSRRTGCTR